MTTISSKLDFFLLCEKLPAEIDGITKREFSTV